MSKVKIQGHASGTGVLTVTAPNTSTDRTITLPDSTGTLATTADSVGGANGVDFNDNVKARFGTGNDLEIYHDGSNSYISDAGTGILVIRSDTSFQIQAANGEAYFNAVKDAETALYHNDVRKFETTATGVAVTGGVAIGGTGASNTLDDYEEGTWTPSVGGNATYTTQIGKYTKVGNMVTLVCEININNIGNAANTASVSGAPFTPIAGSHAASGAVGYHANLAVNVLQLTWRMDGGNAGIHHAGLTSPSGTMSAGLGIFGSGARVLFGITYIAA